MKTELFFFLVLVVFQQVLSQLVVTINNGSHLMDVLCNNGEPLGDDVTIYLNSSIQYNISTCWPISCVVKVSSGTLTITSTTGTPASVTCIDQNDSDPIPTIGFLFNDTSNVILSNLLITGCGASLAEFNNTINSSQPYFTKDHSGLFIFSQVSVTITKVTITHYYGFAAILKDTRNTLMNQLLIKHNIGNYEHTGVGMLVLFTEGLIVSPLLNISNSIFDVKYDGNQDENYTQLLCNLESTVQRKFLTVLLRKNSLQPIILLTKINFTPTLLSGVVISMSNSAGSHVIITQIMFTTIAPNTCTGSAVTIYGNNIHGSTLIEITETIFESNLSYKVDSFNTTTLSEYGPVLINMMNIQHQVIVYFRKVIFENNAPALNGACLTVSSTTYKIKVILESVIARSNSQKIWNLFLYNTGLFVVDHADQVVINGTQLHPSQFCNNSGSVIKTIDSDIILQGHIIFANNSARNGAVINAKDTQVHFEKLLTLTMLNNTAEEAGGVLHIVNSFHQDLPNCALQYSDELSITAEYNTAYLSGNVGYVHPLYHCYSLTQGIVVTTLEYYLEAFGITNSTRSNARLPFSTVGKNIEICGADSLENLQFYSGQTVQIPVRVFDWNNNTIRSQVTVSLQQAEDNRLIIKERMQFTIESNNGSCSQINLTIGYLAENFTNKSEYLNIILSAPDIRTFVIKRMQLLQCPPGFQLFDGVCQCSNTAMQFYDDLKYKGDCDILTLTISKPFLIFPWVGINSANGEFTVTRNCPKENCAFQTEQTLFKYVDTNYVMFSNKSTTPICLPRRQGVACGQCIDGYSVVFGSTECKKCSNWWLWTTVLYLIAGPVLIILLYALKLTLTAGTMNGIIFFAQVCFAGLVQSETISNNNAKYITLVFIGFFNLNLGFPLCLFNGMTELWKGAINLLFPIYLISLIGLIVLISRYSSWFSKKVSPHSIQVLVTVVHLSVSTLLTSVIDVSIPITVWTANGTHRVWRKDGSVEYLSGYHVILFTATLIVAISILFPYLTVLLLGKWFSKKSATCSIYIRPIHEAVNAPYEDKYNYWFTGKLLFVILMYSVYAFNKSSNNKSAAAYVAIMLTVLFFIQASFRPLKNKVLNVIELIFIFSTAVSFFTFYIAVIQIDPSKGSVPFSISVYIAILIFISIIIYHVIMVTGYSGRVNQIMQRLIVKIKQKKTVLTNETEVDPNNSHNLQIDVGSFSNSLNDYREPLIGHTSIDM